MESNVLRYFNKIPDNTLLLMAVYSWENLEELCTLLTLDLEISRQERQFS
jgi:hypothetical protein